MSHPLANPDWARAIPERSLLTSELCQLAQRGTSLLTIFTGGARSSYRYVGQYRAGFKQADFGALLTEQRMSTYGRMVRSRMLHRVRGQQWYV